MQKLVLIFMLFFYGLASAQNMDMTNHGHGVPNDQSDQRSRQQGKFKEPKNEGPNPGIPGSGKPTEKELAQDKRIKEHADKWPYFLSNYQKSDQRSFDLGMYEIDKLHTAHSRKVILSDARKNLRKAEEEYNKDGDAEKAREYKRVADELMNMAADPNIEPYKLHKYEEQYWERDRKENPIGQQVHMWQYGQAQGNYLRELLLPEYYEDIKSMDHYDQRKQLLDHAKESLNHAKNYYDNNPSHYRYYPSVEQATSDEARETLDQVHLADVLMDIAVDTAIDVVAGWPRDIYEAVSGKNVRTGEELSGMDRTFAIAGVVSGGLGTKLYRPFKAIAKVMAHNKISGKALNTAENLVTKNSPETIEKVRVFYNKYKDKISKRFANHDDLAEFFSEPVNIRTLDKDTKAYRYYEISGASDPRGSWLTPNKVNNPRAELSLPKEGNYVGHEWTIPKGTEILEGKVAPAFGQPGGGMQYFIPNNEVLLK